jgi:hypothetical protein
MRGPPPRVSRSKGYGMPARETRCSCLPDRSRNRGRASSRSASTSYRRDSRQRHSSPRLARLLGRVQRCRGWWRGRGRAYLRVAEQAGCRSQRRGRRVDQTAGRPAGEDYAARGCRRGSRAQPACGARTHLGAHAPSHRNDAPPPLVVLTVGFSNDNSTRPVDRLTVNLRVPSRMQLYSHRDSSLSGGGPGDIADAPSAVIGGDTGVIHWNEVLGPIDQHVNVVRYLTLGSPPAGIHRIEAELVNGDLLAVVAPTPGISRSRQRATGLSSSRSSSQ